MLQSVLSLIIVGSAGNETDIVKTAIVCSKLLIVSPNMICPRAIAKQRDPASSKVNLR